MPRADICCGGLYVGRDFEVSKSLLVNTDAYGDGCVRMSDVVMHGIVR